MNIKHRTEEGIIAFLILISIFDFFKLLPPDIDFIKKIISWTLLGYLLYNISITKQIFGNKTRHVDIILILTYFLLVSKYLIHFAEEVAGKDTILSGLYSSILLHKFYFSYWSFYVGCVLIVILSIYLTLTLHVHKPSLIHVVHEQGIPKTLRKKTERFIIIFLIINAFFLFVFNLMIEWLTIALDASLIVLALVFYLFTAFRRHSRKFSRGSFIYRVGEFGENFYQAFIALFHSKKRIHLGLSGILVLHLLTDIGNFIVPYVLAIEGMLYLPHFDAAHMPLMGLFLKDIVGMNALEIIIAALIYILNIFAMLLLLFLPSYIWYKVYKKAGFRVKNIYLSFFYISLFIFILTPIFKLQPIQAGTIIGIDIQTIVLGGLNLPPLISAFILGTIIYFICFNHRLKENLLFIAALIVDIFFGFYIYHFFTGTVGYYWHTINALLGDSYIFVPSFLIVFLVITSAFYIIGFIAFIYETKKEFKQILTPAL